MSQDNDRSLNLNNECQVLKQKLKDLEKSLKRSNRRVHELETRVSELELSKENMESRSSTDTRRKMNLKENIESKTDKIEYLRKQKTKPMIEGGSFKNNTDSKQVNRAFFGTDVLTSDERQITRKKKLLLTG